MELFYPRPFLYFKGGGRRLTARVAGCTLRQMAKAIWRPKFRYTRRAGEASPPALGAGFSGNATEGGIRKVQPAPKARQSLPRLPCGSGCKPTKIETYIQQLFAE